MPESRALRVGVLLNVIKIKSENNVNQSSGKDWLRVVKKSITVIGRVAGVLLVAPLKLPGKILSAAHYVAIFAGIVKAIDTDEQQRD